MTSRWPQKEAPHITQEETNHFLNLLPVTVCESPCLELLGKLARLPSATTSTSDRNPTEASAFPPTLTRKLTKLAPKLIRGLWFLKESTAASAAAEPNKPANQEEKKVPDLVHGTLKSFMENEGCTPLRWNLPNIIKPPSPLASAAISGELTFKLSAGVRTHTLALLRGDVGLQTLH